MLLVERSDVTVAELPARAANDKDPWFHLAVIRAQWAIGVAHKQAAFRENARSALQQGDVCHALQILNRMGSTDSGGHVRPLKMGLSVAKSWGDRIRHDNVEWSRIRV